MVHRFCKKCVGRVFCWNEIGSSVRFGLICVGFERLELLRFFSAALVTIVII